MGLASRSGLKLTADVYVPGNFVFVQGGVEPFKPDLYCDHALFRLVHEMHTHSTLSLGIRIDAGECCRTRGVQEGCIFDVSVKGEFLEYAGEDRQSNSGIRVMNFIVGYP